MKNKIIYLLITLVIATLGVLSIEQFEVKAFSKESNVAFIDDREKERVYFSINDKLEINLESKLLKLKKSIYKSKENILLTHINRMNENIIFTELYEDEEKGYYFEINLLENNEISLLNKGFSYNVPCITTGDNNIALSYNFGGKSMVKYIDISGIKEYVKDEKGNSHKKDNKELLISKEYIEYDDGKYKGDKIVYSGGTDNNTWAQIISADNENMEESTKVKIVKIDGKTKETTSFDIGHKIIYIYGNNKYVVTSAYSNLEPLVESAMIYKIDGSSLKLVKILKGVESGNDIKEVKFLSEEEALILTPQIGYYCNLETGEEKAYEFEEGYYASIKNSGFELWKMEKGKAKIKYIAIN